MLNRNRKTPTTPENTVPDTDNPTIEQRIEALRDEADELPAQEAADPISGAHDLPAWHARDRRRRERRVEIEHQIRDLTEYGDLVDTHADAIRHYVGTARGIAARHARLIEKRVFRPNDSPTGLDREITEWWQALTKLARQLPLDTDAARALLTRETEQWFRLRDSWLVATAMRHGHREVPSPELGDALPDWLRWGAHRVDHLDDRGDE